MQCLSMRAQKCLDEDFETPENLPLLVLPEEVDVLSLQPVSHGLVHVLPALVVGVREVVQDGVAKAVLCSSKVLVTLGVLVKLFLGECGNSLAVDRDHLVLLVEELDVLSFPLAILKLSEEDESAVAFDVDRDTLEDEALSDGGLHLANASLLGEVDVGQCTVFSVHDEITVGTSFDGDIDELFDGQATRPGGPDVCAFLGEQTSVVLPFRSISVYRPSFAQFCDAQSGEGLFCGSVDVVGNNGLALFG